MKKRRGPPRIDPAESRNVDALARTREKRDKDAFAEQKARELTSRLFDSLNSRMAAYPEMTDLRRDHQKLMWLNGQSNDWPEGPPPPEKLRKEYQRARRLELEFRTKWKDWLPAISLDPRLTQLHKEYSEAVIKEILKKS